MFPLLTMTSICTAIYAPQPPPLVPPPAVANEASRIFTELGVPPNDPNVFYQPIDREIATNGHTIWRFRCLRSPNISTVLETNDLTIEIDEQLGSITHSSSDSLAKKTEENFASGVPETVTQSQAVATFNTLFSKMLPNATGDWRTDIERSKLGGEGINWWYVTKTLYLQNAPIPSIYASGRIDPYTGKVYSWHHSQEAIPVGVGQTLLSKAQAEAIAKQAYINFAGNALLPTDRKDPILAGQPAWIKIADSSIARLGYRFLFRLSAIAGTPDLDPSLPFDGRLQQDFMMVIDAETGEILDGYPLLGSGFNGTGKLNISPRILMIQMLKEKPSDIALTLAMAEGKLCSAKLPSSKARLFSVRVTNTYRKKGSDSETEDRIDTLKLAYNPVSHHLTWYADYKKQWFGVKLTEKKSQIVADWLKASKP
jgi:hypothetical protein